MAWNWLKKIRESDESAKQRHIEEFAKSEDFKKMLREEASSLLEESKKKQKENEWKKKQEHQQKVKEAEESIETIGEQMKDSNEPFVNVLSLGFTPENGLEVKLDYNKAFIRYLNKAGIEGTNDEETIRLWLAHLNYDISEEAKAEDYLMNGVSEDEMPSMSYEEMFEMDKADDDEEKPNSGW